MVGSSFARIVWETVGNRLSWGREMEKSQNAALAVCELYRMNDGWIERQNVAEKAEHAAVRRGMEQKLRAFWRW